MPSQPESSAHEDAKLILGNPAKMAASQLNTAKRPLTSTIAACAYDIGRLMHRHSQHPSTDATIIGNRASPQWPAAIEVNVATIKVAQHMPMIDTLTTIHHGQLCCGRGRA